MDRLAEKDLDRQKLTNEQKDAIIYAFCRRYIAIFVIRCNSDTFKVMGVPEGYKEFVHSIDCYSTLIDAYCDEYVSDIDKERVKHYLTTENLAHTLDRNTTAEVTYRTKDDRFMSARVVEIMDSTVDERLFLMGIVKYEHELENEQRIRRSNDIITSLSESYQVIYRINLDTGSYEVILMNFDRSRFVDNYRDFFELEKDYARNGIDIYYNKNNTEKINTETIRKHFKESREPMEAYYREKNGRWLKLMVFPDKNYSDEQPYVIYAIRECNEEIRRETESIIDTTAVSKMYILVMVIDEKTDYYNCIYCDESDGMHRGPGKLSDFLEIMRKRIYEEDYYIFESLLQDADSPKKGFVEREYRAEDSKGMVHFLSAFSTYVMLPEGGRKLLMVRNIDERAANRARISLLDDQTAMLTNILYALGDDYFGIYYCDLETLMIVPAREDSAAHELILRNNNYKVVMERYANEYVHSDDGDKIRAFTEIDNLKRNLVEDGQVIHCEFRRRFDKEYRWVRMDIQAVRFKNGEVNKIVIAFKDIHDEREIELRQSEQLKTALREAEKANKAKSEFLSNMSHDLRTPMNAVLGMTDIALNHIDDYERVKSCLNKIESAAKGLLSIINDVLDMSYIESGKVTVNEENFSLPDLIHDIVSLLQQQAMDKKLNFTAKAYNVRNEKLFGDRIKIDRILTNVVSNAIKYTDEGGKVSFVVEQMGDVAKNTAQYVFTVKDNGCGMSESFISRIYQPFEREQGDANLRTEGTGLGMPITRNYVDMLGGTMELESKEGVGSTFIIKLPVKYIDRKDESTFDELAKDFEIICYENINDDIPAIVRKTAAFNSGRPIVVAGTYDGADFESEAVEAGMAAYVTEPIFLSDLRKIKRNVLFRKSDDNGKGQTVHDFSGKKILVVDDNLINADIAVDYLTDVNAECETASNGKEAYDIIASGKYFDAVLMDVRMPVMNGCDATKLIRELGTDYASSLPVIAMTANAFKQDMEMTRASGMNDHISKPMSADLLYSVLDKYLS